MHAIGFSHVCLDRHASRVCGKLPGHAHAHDAPTSAQEPHLVARVVGFLITLPALALGCRRLLP